LITYLKNFYSRQQFNPGWLGPWLNPFFLARRSLWGAVAASSQHLQGELLDVGCGVKPYRGLFSSSRYIGLDIDSELTRKRGIADVFYDGARFPLSDGEFQSVLCNQVLEHVFTPDAFLQEVHRVMRPGGKLLLTVPFLWDEHEQPFDYARYSSFGLRALLERNGFRIIEHRKLLADASVLFQLGITYLWKVFPGTSPMRNLLFTVVFVAPLTLLGMLAGWLLPRNPDLFLDQLVVAEKIS
jgi:SAM-dependent methyltransferase